MKVFITPEFINDLRESADIRFLRQVLNHTLQPDGTFRNDANDHRYHGIKDLWIRYVSKGRTGFRVIYLKKGDEIHLYRAGQHSIENKLGEPRNLELSIPLEQVQVHAPVQRYAVDFGSLLKTYEPTYLKKIFLSMYHISHQEIYIISPFVSNEMISRHHHFGRFLDRAVEEDTIVTLVTRPPLDERLDVFSDLEERSIFVYFNKDLHSKLYVFGVNAEKLSPYNRDMKKTAILGSANLTPRGLGLNDEPTNDELCYKLPDAMYGEVYNYSKKLMLRSLDYKSYITRHKRR